MYVWWYTNVIRFLFLVISFAFMLFQDHSLMFLRRNLQEKKQQQYKDNNKPRRNMVSLKRKELHVSLERVVKK